MSGISTLVDEVIVNRFNPSAIQRLALDTLESISAGEMQVVDPTNPFVFLMETSAVNTSAVLTQHEALVKQLYPSMAVTMDELFLHMSDLDYLNLFATPTLATYTLMFSKEELISKAVVTDNPNVGKITVPKHSEFKVGGIPFTLQYPIDIEVLSQGRLRVRYDLSNPSPLETIGDNVIPFTTVTLEGSEYIKFDVPVLQIEMVSMYDQISLSTGLNVNYQYSDQYFTARVYMEVNGGWKEIPTTHTDKVLDPTVVTGVLKVISGVINLQIPQFYIDLGLVTGGIRIDIHTTKGVLDTSLDSFTINSFVAKWKDHDLNDTLSPFSIPLTNYSSMAVYSSSTLSGGGDMLSFMELRNRVITNSLGNTQEPVTGLQLESKLGLQGYTLIKDIDNVTDRVYLVSKKLPNHIDNPIVSTLDTIVSDMDDIRTKHGVYDNGERVTISPKSLWVRDELGSRLLDSMDVYAIDNLSPTDKLKTLNENSYLQTPFHYLLDTSDNDFTVTPFYLENPELLSRILVDQNDNYSYSIVSDKFSVDKMDNGYRLKVSTKSTGILGVIETEFLITTLSFKPTGQSTKVSIPHSGIEYTESGDLVFIFDLESSFDFESQNDISLNNFKSYSIDNLSYSTNLTTEFELTYYVRGRNPNDLDIVSDKLYFLGINDKALSIEHLVIKLGSYVDNLWTRARSVLDSVSYRKYESDVFAVYTENVYERDSTGSLTLSLDANGDVGFNLLHSIGDPILDADGNPVIKYFAGQLVLDSRGEPVIENQGSILRDFDVFLLDARFRYSTSSFDSDYYQSLGETILTWLDTDIKTYKEWLLEQTELMFYPTRTTGRAKVLVLDAEETTIDLEQRFVVSLYLTKDNFINTELRDSLSKLVAGVINRHLTQKRVSINEIIKDITDEAGESVIGLDVEGLGGSANYTTVSLVDDVDSLSVSKKLTLDLDGVISIVDDIDVLFIKHEA